MIQSHTSSPTMKLSSEAVLSSSLSSSCSLSASPSAAAIVSMNCRAARRILRRFSRRCAASCSATICALPASASSSSELESMRRTERPRWTEDAAGGRQPLGPARFGSIGDSGMGIGDGGSGRTTARRLRSGCTFSSFSSGSLTGCSHGNACHSDSASLASSGSATGLKFSSLSGSSTGGSRDWLVAFAISRSMTSPMRTASPGRAAAARSA